MLIVKRRHVIGHRELACIHVSGNQKGNERVPSTLRFRKFPGKLEGVWCFILATHESSVSCHLPEPTFRQWQSATELSGTLDMTICTVQGQGACRTLSLTPPALALRARAGAGVCVLALSGRLLWSLYVRRIKHTPIPRERAEPRRRRSRDARPREGVE